MSYAEYRIRARSLAVLSAAILSVLGCDNPAEPGPTVEAQAPTFSPSTGSYGAAQTVVISTLSEGAGIRYTMDGSTPSAAYGQEYTGIPLSVTYTMVIKAVAYGEEYLESPVVEATYTIPGKVATPYTTPPAGTYATSQTVGITTATDGADIYYTLDGSAPTSMDGTPYVGPILIDRTTNLRAIAYKNGQTESNVMNVTFTIGVKVATPVFSIAAGTYAQSQSVVISTTTPGAEIRYTTNGANPTQTYGALYAGPVTVSKTQTLKAIAYAPGKLDSNIATAAYVIALDSNNAGDSTAVATDGVNVYVAYYSNAVDDLYFLRSTDNGATWDAPIGIDRVGLVGLHLSMFRKANALYISYYDDTNDDLKVAVSVNNGQTWTVYRVDSVGSVGQYTGIYVDGSNAIHVVYYDVTNTALKYAKSADGGNSWTVSQVDNAADCGKFASLTGDGVSDLHVAYYDDTNDDLKYAYWNGAVWSVAAVDQTVGRDVGQHARIVRDGIGNLYILYQDATRYDLKLAKYSGAWAVSTVLDAGDVGGHVGVFVDGSDFLDVVYYNDSLFRNEFVQSIDGGATWSSPAVIDDSGVGTNASLAGFGGTLWTSYYDAINADLKAARSADAGGTWTIF
jgi:hypothetical protein